MPNDPNRPKLLATLPTEVEAILVVSHLTGHGIKAHIAGSGSPGGWLEERFDTQVVVRETDFARAKELIDLIRPHTAGDPSSG